MRDSATLLGTGALAFIREVGAMTSFLFEAIWQAFKKPYRGRLILEQMEFVGVGSLFIVLLTGTFTGAVFTLQTVAGLERVGMENVVGSTVMLAVSRELAPVLTALMVTGRLAQRWQPSLELCVSRNKSMRWKSWRSTPSNT